MAKDDTTPGLLSKMVRFVRSPGVQWVEHEDPSTGAKSTLSKQALKEMIERRRRNDFVRKREFDMLRKLRLREVTGGGKPSESALRPSFFQSSMPSRPDDRAMTLKKIDEIEAQMSMQWWRTKHGPGGAASTLPPNTDFLHSNTATRPSLPSSGITSEAISSTAFARTAPDDLRHQLATSSGMLGDANGSVPAPAAASAFAANFPPPQRSPALEAQNPARPSPVTENTPNKLAARAREGAPFNPQSVPPLNPPVVTARVVPPLPTQAAAPALNTVPFPLPASGSASSPASALKTTPTMAPTMAPTTARKVNNFSDVPAIRPSTGMGALPSLPSLAVATEPAALPSASTALPVLNAAIEPLSKTLPLKAQSAVPRPAPALNPLQARLEASQAVTAPAELPSNLIDFSADFLPMGKSPVKPSVDANSNTPSVTAPAASQPAKTEALVSRSEFSMSKQNAVDVFALQHDPELEEAAIRFANGDDAGAQAGLMLAISAKGSRHSHAETWLTLLDLYRATAQQAPFEVLSMDYARKFGRSSPAWVSIPGLRDAVGAMPGKNASSMTDVAWKSPAQLSVQSVTQLKALADKSSRPLNMDWKGLRSIDDAAVPVFLSLLLAWAGQDVKLIMQHANALEDVLRKGTPSCVPSVDKARWNLLMTYLRLAHRPDEFELAALDFCVTYEVSPPSWERATCQFKLIGDDGKVQEGNFTIGPSVLDPVDSEMFDSVVSSDYKLQVGSGQLSGLLMGDPDAQLTQIDSQLKAADLIHISCEALVRVDFSAAGSLLNWASSHQAQGRIVHFTQVHRLIASLFHVIGISEHAKITSRTD